jgi:hypothetical protein
MGGSGSTRWNAHLKRWTAEDCLNLSIFDLRRLLGASVFREQQSRQSILVWTRRKGGLHSSVGYSLTWQPTAQLTLTYTITPTGGESFQLANIIALESTPCQYGGVRWWFTCPVCKRRIGVLYYRRAVLIHTAEWACRHCHDLTYNSVQEAHVLDRGGGLYKAYGYALDRFWKAKEQAQKHHRGHKAEKAWRAYREAAERLRGVTRDEKQKAEERYQEVLSRINALER